jgi:hypothetical protein
MAAAIAAALGVPVPWRRSETPGGLGDQAGNNVWASG